LEPDQVKKLIDELKVCCCHRSVKFRRREHLVIASRIFSIPKTRRTGFSTSSTPTKRVCFFCGFVVVTSYLACLRPEGDPNSVLAHCLGHWRISPAYHDLLYHPAILVPACQLLRASVRFWHDQLFLKPPKYFSFFFFFVFYLY
jgi:hypothetical protein